MPSLVIFYCHVWSSLRQLLGTAPHYYIYTSPFAFFTNFLLYADDPKVYKAIGSIRDTYLHFIHFPWYFYCLCYWQLQFESLLFENKFKFSNHIDFITPKANAMLAQCVSRIRQVEAGICLKYVEPSTLSALWGLSTLMCTGGIFARLLPFILYVVELIIF